MCTYQTKIMYEKGFIVLLKDKLENILTTDYPLSNRGAKAMAIGFSFSAVHVPVTYSGKVIPIHTVNSAFPGLTALGGRSVDYSTGSKFQGKK